MSRPLAATLPARSRSPRPRPRSPVSTRRRQQQFTNDLNTAATGSTTTSRVVTWQATLSSDAANWSWNYLEDNATLSGTEQGTNLAGGYTLATSSSPSVSLSASGNDTTFTLLETDSVPATLTTAGTDLGYAYAQTETRTDSSTWSDSGTLGGTVSASASGGDSYTTTASWPALPGYSDTVTGSDGYTRLISATLAASDGGYSANQTGSGTWVDSASRTEATESDSNDTTGAHNLSG